MFLNLKQYDHEIINKNPQIINLFINWNTLNSIVLMSNNLKLRGHQEKKLQKYSICKATLKFTVEFSKT